MTPSQRFRRRWLEIFAICVAALAVVGALLVWYPWSRTAPVSPPDRADGPTFYQALSQLNGSVQNTSGGPWTLYTVYGIATPVPFSPSALGWNEQNETVNSCGHLFNGLTMWNGSIPLFNGTYNSGTAPFWQFFYFSNASGEILVASNVLGVPQVFPPIPMSSPCMTGSVLGLDPWDFARNLNPLPANSPTLASSAVEGLGPSWFANNPTTFEAFRFGNNYWGSGNPAGLIINFERCGEVSRAGVQPFASVGVSSSGSFVTSYVGIEGCGNIYSFGPPVDVLPWKIGFTNYSTFLSGASSYTSIPFQALVENNTGGYYPDASGIVSWMIRLTLTNSTGAVLPTATSSCGGWVPTASDCGANGTGWFLLLLSPYGQWLDSYGETSTGANWSAPAVSIVSNQQMVLVSPSTWNLSGDVLSASSTTSNVTLSGSVSI
jgi:hypothetical protein